MEKTVIRVQNQYRDAREINAYSIFDVEKLLIELAAEGKIWMIQGMKDISDSESILIDHYLKENRDLQTYDFFVGTELQNN